MGMADMDIKDLFKKFKSGSGKKDARKGNSITGFFDKNPKMKIILPALGILIAVVVAVLIILSGTGAETELEEGATVAGQAVAVLPEIERTQGETAAENVDPFAEDVIANAKITGMIYNSDGYWTAVVQTPYASYTLQVGDYVGSSKWLVESITDSTVTVSLGEKTRTLEMKK